MTVALSVTGVEAVWLPTDTRISYSDGRSPKDDAVKAFSLETSDGVALLGYAGLGGTAEGTEPSDWMSRVLRGRNPTMEESLRVLAGAAHRQLPNHLEELNSPRHYAIGVAFVSRGPRYYGITVRSSEPGGHVVRLRRIQTPWYRDFGNLTRRIVMEGSRARLLHHNGDAWWRDLLRVVKTHDRGRISAREVARQFAALNERVHVDLGGDDGASVGPRCSVDWRLRDGGGSSRSFDRLEEHGGYGPPSIPTEGDVGTLGRLVMERTIPYLERILDAMRRRENRPEMDTTDLERLVSELPIHPDENLEEPAAHSAHRPTGRSVFGSVRHPRVARGARGAQGASWNRGREGVRRSHR